MIKVMTIKLIVIVYIFLWVVCCYAYNPSRCGRLVGKYFPGGPFFSTTQFVSSWGSCRALGLIGEDQRSLFLAANLEQLQLDIARGGGEYLLAFSDLIGCKEEAYSIFASILQENYEYIFYGRSKLDPVNTNSKVEGLIYDTPELRNLCRKAS